MDKDAAYRKADESITALLGEIELVHVEQSVVITRFNAIADKLMATLTALEADVEEETEEINEELAEARAKLIEKKARARFERWKRRLAEQTKDQPAGTPVMLEGPGMGLVMARGYTGRPPKKKRIVEEPPKAKEQIEVVAKTHNPALDNLTFLMDQWVKSANEQTEEYWSERNAWWSQRHQGYVIIQQSSKTGKCRAKILKAKDDSLKTTLWINTYCAADAYNVEHEEKALSKLKCHVTERQYHRYVLTGTLMERSKRSGIVYIFRRLRPTLAFRQEGDNYRYLAALCHHAVAYYQVSWAGALVPTDDLMSHLMYMRGDEHGFWKRSTQHPAHAPQANF